MAKSNTPSITLSKKKLVLLDIFEHCRKKNSYTFDNDFVGEISKKHEFGNLFDVTKTDNSSILPDEIIKQNYCIIHLGKGKHRFIKAAQICFHDFEKIDNKEIPWKYHKSALNEIDTSESNILSVGFNQRIVHDFLYDDIVANPKMYGSRRTRSDLHYKIGKEEIHTTKLQMEIDLVTEYLGVVTVFEGKNNFPDNFAVYQLFHPYLYFHHLRQIGKIKVEDINCCYLLRNRSVDGESTIRLYLYTFEDPMKMDSIRLIKCSQYKLITR
ncbi:type II restriction enzyme [Candidatus Spongiihabitans sp.]|uniref:type II restriction enzyme n=1 Tax=Candidatus Spongiihabitans sp. TaxID=3101308 RepID=UPI003C7A270B